MINLSHHNSNITNHTTTPILPDAPTSKSPTNTKHRKKLESLLTCLISRSSVLAVSEVCYLYIYIRNAVSPR